MLTQKKKAIRKERKINRYINLQYELNDTISIQNNFSSSEVNLVRELLIDMTVRS